jgi:hypothetical protein
MLKLTDISSIFYRDVSTASTFYAYLLNPLLNPLAKKYNELFPKEKKEKAPKKEQQPKQPKKEQPKKKKPEPSDDEEEDNTPKEPAKKFVDPFVDMPKR